MLKVLLGGTLIDGHGGPPRPETSILIDGSKIAGVYSLGEAETPIPPDAESYSLAGKYVLPGLIDCHVHLCFNGNEEVLADASLERDELLLLRAAKNAERALRAGITTLRDCGAPRGVAWSLREAVCRGLLVVPRLVLCGRPLTISGGHTHSWGGEADGVESVRHAVRQLIKEGADFIKVMASGGVVTPRTDPRRIYYTLEELRAIASEAHRLGRRVTAHCYTPSAMDVAMEAGVDCIEHAAFLDEDFNRTFVREVANRMLSTSTWVVPTLAGGHRNAQRLMSSTGCPRKGEQFITQIEQKFEIFREMLEMGVKMAAGTDAGVPLTFSDDLVFELELMVGAGAPRLEAIKMGTKSAAQLIDREGELGTIEKGKEADILVVDADPTENIGALRSISMVIQAGRIVHQVIGLPDLKRGHHD